MEQIRKSWLALDLRALALFRIFLGLFVAGDFLTHLSGVQAFVSDLGFLPRSHVHMQAASRIFCVFMGSGSAWVQGIWMLFGACCSLCIIFGLHTRTASFWCWFLLASLHLRNHFAGDRGCMMLELMLFWGFFLPLEARWSLTARDQPGWNKLPNSFRSLGTAALILQFSFIYIFTAAMKCGSSWLLDGDAILIACRSRQVVTDYGEWLTQFRDFLHVATFATLAWEVGIAILLLSPVAHDRLRTIAVLSLQCFHLHNEFVFRLGCFPFMNACLVLVLLPTSFWDGVGKPVLAFFERRLGSRESSEEQEAALPPAYQLGIAARLWLAICLVYCLLRNIAVVPDPRYPDTFEPFTSFGRLFRLEQQWDLFSPNPPNDFWFRLVGKDRDGHEVDLLRGDHRVTLERPTAPVTLTPVYFWRMALFNCVVSDSKDNLQLREDLYEYWMRQYAGTYSELRFEVVNRSYDPFGIPLPATVSPLMAPKSFQISG